MTRVLDISESGNPTVDQVDQVAIKLVAFDGTAGKGAVGSVPLFTVTGDVAVRVVGVCKETVVSPSGTLVIGTANNTTGLLASIAASALALNDVHVTGSSPAEIGDMTTTVRCIANGADIIMTVGTGAVTDGTVQYYCLWRPLSTDGSVVAA